MGVRRTLAAIMGSRMGSRALLAGATPRARPLQGGISRDGLSMAPLPWASSSRGSALQSARGLATWLGQAQRQVLLVRLPRRLCRVSWSRSDRSCAGHQAHAADGAGVDAVRGAAAAAAGHIHELAGAAAAPRQGAGRRALTAHAAATAAGLPLPGKPAAAAHRAAAGCARKLLQRPLDARAREYQLPGLLLLTRLTQRLERAPRSPGSSERA